MREIFTHFAAAQYPQAVFIAFLRKTVGIGIAK